MNDTTTIEPAPRKTDAETLKAEILDKLAYAVGKDPIVAKPHDWLAATILVVRDRAIDRWMESTRAAYRTGAKRVYYLSLEFLIGRLLRDAMTNLGLVESIHDGAGRSRRRSRHDRAARARRRARQWRPRPARRLLHGKHGDAAKSPPMATASATSTASSTRRSRTATRSRCRRTGWPTAISGSSSGARSPTRSASAARSTVGTIDRRRRRGRSGSRRRRSLAVAYDTPIVGWRGKRVNTLRLWSAHAVDPILLDAFNRGDHIGALAERTRAETHHPRPLSRRFDARPGRNCASARSIFFVSASLQDLVRRHFQQFGDDRQPSPTRSRSSSTTPIRRSPSPS